MKLLLDMNISPRWVKYLSIYDIYSVHWSTVGEPNAKDTDIIAYAIVSDFIIMTQDLDFTAQLALTHCKKPSIVQIRSDNISPEVIGQKVVFGLRRMQAELQNGALLTIDLNKSKIRLLPFCLNP